MIDDKYVPRTATVVSLQGFDELNDVGLTMKQAWLIAEWCEKLMHGAIIKVMEKADDKG